MEDENIIDYDETNNVYDKVFDIGDMFLIVIDDNESIAKVKNIEYDLKNVTFVIDEIDVNFKIDDNDNIILKTEDYTIIDIEKIISFEFEGLDSMINTLLTRDIYSELEIKTEEIKQYIYTDVEKRESLISSLIISMKIYEDSFKIKNISNISQVFIDMIENMDDKSLEQFQEINDFNRDKVLPYWLIPVVTDIKRLYLDDPEPIVEDDILVVDFIEEYNEIEKIYNSENSYQNVLNIYNNTKYRPLQNLYIENGLKLEKYEYEEARSFHIYNFQNFK